MKILLISTITGLSLIGLSLVNAQEAEVNNLERYNYDSRHVVLEASSSDIQEAISFEQLSHEQKNEAPLSETSQVEYNEEEKASIELYRQTYFSDSPITTDMIINVSKHYNIPAGFVLAVGHNESHMGTKGRAAETMNPMNVGNTDAGDYKAVVCGVANNCLNGWEEGLDAFGKLIRDCYFHEGEQINLKTWVDRDFRAVRCGLEGKRYMTDRGALSKYQERIQNLQTFNIQY